MTHRIEKVNELVAHELGALFERELSLKPGVFITIVSVDTTRDLRYTRVLVSIFPESESSYGIETLKHEKGRLQKELHARLTMKIKPTLLFSIDTTEREAEAVEKVLKQIADEKREE